MSEIQVMIEDRDRIIRESRQYTLMRGVKTPTLPTDLCRCGHTRDEHWYSGFVCFNCGCTYFKHNSR